jgi:uncharacterized membrane protein YdjX (TVP38/TMEM64 family)
MTPIIPDRSRLARALPLGVVALGAILGWWVLRDWLSFETLAARQDTLIAARDANYLLIAALFWVAYVGIVSFSLPGALIATLTGGFLFGTIMGTALNVTAASMGATLIFLAAKTSLGTRLAARLDHSSGTLKSVKQGLDENQWSMLFVMRLLPVVPFFVANLLPALLNVPVRRFVISTVLGIIPGSLVYTSVGAGLGDVLARGDTPDLGVIFEPAVLWPILGLAALSLLPIAIKALRGRGKADQ